MKTKVIVVLCAPLLGTALAARPQVQETVRPEPGSTGPLDVSLEGLGEASRRARGDTTPGGSVRLSTGRPTESTSPLDCLESIADQATAGCLSASSTPTLGMLYPYPGLDNVFVPRAFVGGGENNQAIGPACTVVAGSGNVASGYVGSFLAGLATVGGGGSNVASGNAATIAGGFGNTASGIGATIGGGGNSTASGQDATIGGGFTNRAGRSATVSGGFANDAAGPYSTVVGGLSNSALGTASTVAGGSNNVASGNHSFAAGRNAKANHGGAFVWGDNLAPDKTSSVANEFNVYASGGVRMFTNSAATTGVLLAPGGSTWTMVSDRAAKENIEPVDARAVLDEVSRLPLSTWNYRDQPDSIRHMGPMAQDFYAAFGLGLGRKTIDTIDPNGVALAAIQGLNELVREKDAEIEELRSRIERLEALVRDALPR